MSDEITVGDVGEFGLIHHIAEIVSSDLSVLGIGDDCAVIHQQGSTELLATTDMLVDGVHFHRSSVDPFELGRRAIAINVSDIASMGGSPTYALTSIAIPTDLQLDFVERLYRGMKQEADRFGLQIAGGNTTRIDYSLVVDVTLLGQVPADRATLRSGARPGDVLAVTGHLGRPAAVRQLEDKIGKAELQQRFPQVSGLPEPRLQAGQALAAGKLVHAMMDISDGLAGDARRLAEASGVGLQIDARKLPIDESTCRIAEEIGADPIDLALSGGEDYELLVSLELRDLASAQYVISPLLLSAIGSVVDASHGVTVRDVRGRVGALRAEGWTHF